MTDGDTVHAVCILLGEHGILIRGPAGIGKSSLGRQLIAERRAEGGFAALVADDRVVLSARNGRIVARPHPAIAGRQEVRGLGILPADHEPACRLSLVVDLQAEPPPRLPEDADLTTNVLGNRLPWLAARPSEASGLVRMALSWQR